jgi:hypothetical protein
MSCSSDLEDRPVNIHFVRRSIFIAWSKTKRAAGKVLDTPKSYS